MEPDSFEIYSHFNPRSRTGSDVTADDAPADVQQISTHAPARGATADPDIQYADDVFQPTLPHGERRFLSVASCTTGAFQPTLPHGERPERVPRQLLRL